MSNRLAGSERARCRNVKCKSKLPTPTSNDHKAFCAKFCHKQFYKRKCLVCEKELPEGYRRQLCPSTECARNWRNFRPTYVFALPSEPNRQSDAKSHCGAGTKIGTEDPATSRIIAGPPLSDFSLWAATLDPPKPVRLPASTVLCHTQPGDLAAEWTAREMERREADDAQYVADDEARLQSEAVDASGNYNIQQQRTQQ